MSRFEIHETGIEGLVLVQRKPFRDARGSFGRLFCAEELLAAGFAKPVAQANLSSTAQRGTVRGLHYQMQPHTEMKFVSCIKGAIFDVAVDIRKSSPTFLQWRSFELSEGNDRSLLIPEGLAHGFQCLSDGCEMIYLHSTPYVPSADRGLNPRDQKINIAWPLLIHELSDKDANLPFLDSNFLGISL